MTVESESPAVAVLGATGYVGQWLCPALVRAGFEVSAVCSPARAFLVQRLGVKVLDPAQLGNGSGFPTVINLAYPTSRRFYRHLTENADIVSLLKRLVRPRGVLVHTSTLAVFGMDLEVPIRLGPVPRRRDVPYVESKLDMEHRLLQAFGAPTRLHIVRLGNVWGPGSPVWTANLAQRLVEDRPVAVESQDGYSNCTDVANVADYLIHLLRQPGGTGAEFHHLAEFSQVRWGEFVGFLAPQLLATPRTVPSVPRGPITLTRDFVGFLRSLPLVAAAKQTVKGPRIGSWIRSILNALPETVVARLEGMAKAKSRVPTAPLDPVSVDLLRLLSCPRQFPSVTCDGWKPPLDLSQVRERTLAWLRHAGFTLHSASTPTETRSHAVPADHRPVLS